MKALLSYTTSFILLFIFLVNAQGIFIEHHETVSCQEVSSEINNGVGNEHEHESCNGHSCGSKHQEIDVSGIHNCDIYDFENTDHQNDCACFADYLQIPVFQSENKVFNFLPETQLVFTLQKSVFQDYKTQNNINKIDVNAPPDKHYQNISSHIVNCSFLC